MNEIEELLNRLKYVPWPYLARHVGDFALYESLLVGCASSGIEGQSCELSSLPQPDEETVSVVKAMREKTLQSKDEKDFLEYFDLLESLLKLLQRDAQ
jgi:hypothetical protein